MIWIHSQIRTGGQDILKLLINKAFYKIYFFLTIGITIFYITVRQTLHHTGLILQVSLEDVRVLLNPGEMFPLKESFTIASCYLLLSFFSSTAFPLHKIYAVETQWTTLKYREDSCLI